MDYHKRLRELRIEHGYTQEQIAFILHTRQEQYSKYENGKRDLPIKHLIALCCLYRVSADYVLGIEKAINKE
ncbi:helix-turn-helix domain-containing protein [Ruminococcus sp. JL13D9]|uniref:helix-turn-helix domain-containing protein n=1 Tax=Ruminococcus sp. JL13D9 TaxID=3233381 RepID=UPI00389A0F6F